MLDTQVIVLNRLDFLNFLKTHHEVAVEMLSTLSCRLRETNIALEDAVLLDLPTRLAKRLLELSEKHGVKTDRGVKIGLRLTQQDLADMVGASRVAVNKQLNRFKTEGLIDIDKQHIIIRPAELGEYNHISPAY